VAGLKSIRQFFDVDRVSKPWTNVGPLTAGIGRVSN